MKAHNVATLLITREKMQRSHSLWSSFPLPSEFQYNPKI